jgi:hypothetical protein
VTKYFNKNFLLLLFLLLGITSPCFDKEQILHLLSDKIFGIQNITKEKVISHYGHPQKQRRDPSHHRGRPYVLG